MNIIRILIVSSISLISCNLQGWDSFEFYPDLSIPYHPVSTKNENAALAFSRGLLAIYAFNYDEAYASFEKASKLDPDLAMAYWGMALAMDEGLDQFVSEKHAKMTFELSEKALSLSKNAPRHEQMYIQALATRFTLDTKADKNELRDLYSQKMKELCSAYPDDLDASVLYAESIMDLMHWRFWELDGTPRTRTEEIITILDSVLKRDPLHVGANHYFIHTIESSKNPQRGLMAATRLDGNYIEWGHLLHTATHIYMRVGEYEKSVVANLKGVEADKKYIEEHGMEGVYPLHYMSHNLFFLSRAYLWLEDYKQALKTAFDMEAFLMPHRQDKSVQWNMTMPLQTYLYYHKWHEIINYPEPDKELEIIKAFWHFARATAYANMKEKTKALEERTQFLALKDDFLSKTEGAKDILDLATDMLNATFAKMEGDREKAETILRNAVEKQDQMNYLYWYYPIRQSLGALLLEMNKAQDAEMVFRESLQRLPRNGRSLFGLSESLKAQKKESYWIEREAKAALKHAEKPLQIKDL